MTFLDLQVLFFMDFCPPEGDLTTKLTMYNNSQTCNHDKKTKFWCSLNFQNIIRRSPQASPTKNWKIKSAVKEQIRDLSCSLNNFERHLQSGAGRFSAPSPFVGLLSHKLFRLVLKSRIFSLTADLIFQFFVGEAWGERRIMFWKFNGNQHLYFLIL